MIRKFNYSPIRSSVYFEKCREIVFEGNTFRIYEAGVTGPILLLLHGGGYSSLTWALFSVLFSEYFKSYKVNEKHNCKT